MNKKPPNMGPKSVRTHMPERRQIEMLPGSLDDLLADDHIARLIWRYVDSINTDRLYDRFTATAFGKGGTAIAPEILLALWMLATVESISSAREIGRRCKTDVAYRWLCGGVSVNYHTISDFRSNNAEFFDEMLVNSITVLLDADLIKLDTVSQDGMRVRASAGSSSFRRKTRLKQLHDQAKEHVDQLKQEMDDDAANSRRQAAKKAAAEDRERRLQQSLEEVEKLAEQKEKRQKGDGKNARCSVTDPEARVMKTADGGFRPAYNVQFVTDADTRLIVHADVCNSGSDRGKMASAHQEVQDKYGVCPKSYIVDSAFATHGDVQLLERQGTAVYSTVKNAKKLEEAGLTPYAPKDSDSPEFAAFRARMATSEAQEVYKTRPSIAEFPNAEFRNRGGTQYRVRGRTKVLASTLLIANVFNFMRMLHLKLA